MPDVRTMYEKEFLYSFDLGGRDVTLTIERVTQGTLTGVGGKKNKKPVVYFKEGKEKKGLGLCITNARTIAGLYGGFETEKWVGKKITLYPTTTDFGGRTVDCIRIRNRIPGSSAPPPSEQREPGSDDGDGYNDDAARAAAAPGPGEMP